MSVTLEKIDKRLDRLEEMLSIKFKAYITAKQGCYLSGYRNPKALVRAIKKDMKNRGLFVHIRGGGKGKKLEINKEDFLKWQEIR